MKVNRVLTWKLIEYSDGGYGGYLDGRGFSLMELVDLFRSKLEELEEEAKHKTNSLKKSSQIETEDDKTK